MRSIKGRWQYILRSQFPSAFRRNYFIGSVGEANSESLSNYVARQTDRHPMVDDRVMAQLESLQFHDPAVRLDEGRIGSHGKFVHSLQIVIENAQGWNETRHEVLRGARDMIVRASASKEWWLARIGLLSNHIHILRGCSMVESPESAALSLLNHLAYAQGMAPRFDSAITLGRLEIMTGIRGRAMMSGSLESLLPPGQAVIEPHIACWRPAVLAGD